MASKTVTRSIKPQLTSDKLCFTIRLLGFFLSIKDLCMLSQSWLRKNLTLDHKSLGELFDPSSPFKVSQQQGWRAARIEGVGGIGVNADILPSLKRTGRYTKSCCGYPRATIHLKEYAQQTSLFAENFSQAVTQSSIASVRISSFMSEYWKKKRRWKALHWI